LRVHLTIGQRRREGKHIRTRTPTYARLQPLQIQGSWEDAPGDLQTCIPFVRGELRTNYGNPGPLLERRAVYRRPLRECKEGYGIGGSVSRSACLRPFQDCEKGGGKGMTNVAESSGASSRARPKTEDAGQKEKQGE
jgi:hypothetical protein